MQCRPSFLCSFEEHLIFLTYDEAGLKSEECTLALLSLFNFVIGVRAMPQSFSIDYFTEDYSRMFTYGVLKRNSKLMSDRSLKRRIQGMARRL